MKYEEKYRELMVEADRLREEASLLIDQANHLNDSAKVLKEKIQIKSFEPLAFNKGEDLESQFLRGYSRIYNERAAKILLHMCKNPYRWHSPSDVSFELFRAGSSNTAHSFKNLKESGAIIRNERGHYKRGTDMTTSAPRTPTLAR
jgi:hypothetical protein